MPSSGHEDVCLIRGDQGRAIRALLDRIADKWALLIIATLHTQRLRFTSLQRCIPGISQRMLSLTLRKLERDGLVTRTVHAEVPPRVEYELTDLATTLIPHAVALANWAIEHNPDIDAHRAAGKPVGVHATDGTLARRYREAGCTLITTAADATAITRDTAAQLGLAGA